MITTMFLVLETSYYYISSGEDRNMVLTVDEGGGLFARKKLNYIDYNQLWNVAAIINRTGGHLINKAAGKSVMIIYRHMISEADIVVDNTNTNDSDNQLWYYSNGHIFSVLDDLVLGMEKKDGRISLMKYDITMTSPFSHIWIFEERMYIFNIFIISGLQHLPYLSLDYYLRNILYPKYCHKCMVMQT